MKTEEINRKIQEGIKKYPYIPPVKSVIETTCDYCDKPIYKRLSDLKRYKHKFCNISHQRTFSNLENNPNPNTKKKPKEVKIEDSFDDDVEDLLN